MAFGHWKKYINDGYSSLQNVFGRLTSSFEIVFLTANQVFMATFGRRKNTLTMALVHHKMYLVIQLPLRRKYFRWKKWIAYDGFLRLKMSVSDGLVGNIVLSTRLLLTDVDGLLPSTLLICDGFLCCCDELWPSLIAIFFVVSVHFNDLPTCFRLTENFYSSFCFWNRKLLFFN